MGLMNSISAEQHLIQNKREGSGSISLAVISPHVLTDYFTVIHSPQILIFA